MKQRARHSKGPSAVKATCFIETTRLKEKALHVLSDDVYKRNPLKVQ